MRHATVIATPIVASLREPLRSNVGDGQSVMAQPRALAPLPATPVDPQRAGPCVQLRAVGPLHAQRRVGRWISTTPTTASGAFARCSVWKLEGKWGRVAPSSQQKTPAAAAAARRRHRARATKARRSIAFDPDVGEACGSEPAGPVTAAPSDAPPPTGSARSAASRLVVGAKARASFFCRACGGRFDDAAAVSDHVHVAHREWFDQLTKEHAAHAIGDDVSERAELGGARGASGGDGGAAVGGSSFEVGSSSLFDEQLATPPAAPPATPSSAAPVAAPVADRYADDPTFEAFAALVSASMIEVPAVAADPSDSSLVMLPISAVCRIATPIADALPRAFTAACKPSDRPSTKALPPTPDLVKIYHDDDAAPTDTPRRAAPRAPPIVPTAAASTDIAPLHPSQYMPLPGIAAAREVVHPALEPEPTRTSEISRSEIGISRAEIGVRERIDDLPFELSLGLDWWDALEAPTYDAPPAEQLATCPPAARAAAEIGDLCDEVERYADAGQCADAVASLAAESCDVDEHFDAWMDALLTGRESGGGPAGAPPGASSPSRRAPCPIFDV